MIAEQAYSRRANKRAFSIFLALCLMLSLLAGLGPAAWADSEPLPGIIKYNGEYIAHPRTVRDLFDADYYLERYPELKDLLGLSGDVNRLSADEREILLTHFMEKGLQEEKTCSPYLNLVRYRAAHPELEREFGDNWDKYVEYYFTTGRLMGHDPFVSEEDLRIQKWLWEEYGDEIDPIEHREYWDDPDEEDEPRPLINKLARRSITGYQLYANPNGTGKQSVSNGYFAGWFYPDVYQSILRDPRRGNGTPEYTVMIYLCGTDLEDRNGSASQDLINALAAQYDLSRVNVLVLAGGTMFWHSKAMQQNNNGVNLCLYYLDPDGVRNGADGSAGGKGGQADWSLDNVDNILTGDTADRKGSLRLLASYDQVCMGDSELLLGFLDTAYDLFPADHYWLSLWNHGTGSAGGICAGDAVSQDENASAYRGINIANTSLSLAKIEEALNSCKIVKERGDVDILSLDACLMAGIEEAYNFSPYVRFLIASEEMTTGDVPFDKYLKAFKTGEAGLSAGELAVNAANAYIHARSGDGRNASTMSVYDLTTLDECADRMNAFGRAMSALLKNEKTGAQAAAYLEKSANRVFNFGHSDDSGMDYLDLYDFLSRLQPYLAYEQQASGNAEAAALYRDAEKAIRELLQVPFVAYRGGVFANSFIQEEDATYADSLLPLNMAGTRLSGLWGALGYDYLSGVTVYFPRSSEVKELGSYGGQNIFPGYIEMLNGYLQITRSKEHLQKYAAAAWELSNNYSPLFQDQGMAVSECAYQDKDGKEQKVLALRAEFSPAPDPTVTAGLDAPTAFLQTVSKYDVAVLRSQTTLDQDGYENDNAIDIVVARSENLYPGEGMTGQVSLDVESGELNDTSGFAVNLSSMKLNARLVTGYTGKESKAVMDWGLGHSKEKALESVLRSQTTSYAEAWKLDFNGLDGIVYTSDSAEQGKDAILIFGRNETGGNYTYKGAFLMPSDTKEIDADPVNWVAPDKSVGISLYHYMLSGKNSSEIQNVEKSGLNTGAPKFAMVYESGYLDEDKLPVLSLVPLANPDGTGIQSPDYSRFALEITGKDETNTSVYAPESAIYDSTEYRSSPYQAGSDAPPAQDLVQGQAVGNAQTNKLETVHKSKPEAAEASTSVEKADVSAAEQPSAEKPSTEEPPAEQPAAAEPVQQPAASEPVQQPAAAEPVQQPAASEPVQQPAASEPVQQPEASEPVQQPAASEPVQQPEASEPVQQPAAETPAQQTTAEVPIQQITEEVAVQQPAPVESASTESVPETVSDSAPEAENTAEETPEQ